MRTPSAAVAAVLAVAITLSATALAAAHPPRPKHHKPKPKPPAVKSVHMRYHQSDAWVMRLKVNDFRFGTVVAHGQIGGKRESIPRMARRTHALAGVNTDAFHWGEHVSPLSGVVRDGVVLKTPRTDHRANLFFTSTGRAYIGAAPWTLTANGYPLSGINSDGAIESRRLTVLTAAHPGMVLPEGCATVTLVRAAGHWVVSWIASERARIKHISANQRVIVACRHVDQRWITDALAVGGKVFMRFAWKVPGLGKAKITTLTSGIAVLVRYGRPFYDNTRYFSPKGRNPETIGCVSRDHRRLLLAVVDGRSKRSRGVSYAETTRYMLRLGCWTGLVFDGGGSTVMFAHNKVLNRPSDGHLRKVPNGLFIYRKPVKHHKKHK